MAIDHLVVIGGSAGALDALQCIVKDLPADFPAPICIVVHMSPQSPGAIHRILERVGMLPAEIAVDGRKLEAGRIYVAAPDHHLLVEPNVLRVTRGPKENMFRPAVDPLFRSAAQVYGPRAIGVVLTGNLDDGTAGLWAIKRLGGVAIVQDPAGALFPSMPCSAIEHVEVDYRVAVDEIAPLLVRLTATSVQDRIATASHAMDVEVNIARGDSDREAGVEQLGEPSAFACPECHGTLRQLVEGQRTRFRCHTGHAYSLPTLSAAIDDAIDGALWNAIRAIDESGRLLLHLAGHSIGEPSQDDLKDRANYAFADSEILRAVAERRGARGNAGVTKV